MALIEANDAAERARDVREQPFGHLEPHAYRLQDRRIGTTKGVQGERRDGTERVELSGRFREAVEWRSFAARGEEQAFGRQHSEDRGGQIAIRYLVRPVIFHQRWRPFDEPLVRVNEVGMQRGNLVRPLTGADQELAKVFRKRRAANWPPIRS